jgi:ubiquinone/menaquinone biosynthesis C-methylase UbiE
VGIMQKIVSQAVEPRGALGWVTARIMVASSYTYCGNLIELLDPQPEDDVLEVACGPGVFVQRCAPWVRYVAGLDHSELQVKMARKRNRDRIAAGTTEIVKGDATALPWQNKRFSAVTCNCLGCFAEPLASLKEMHRVLNPGGRVVLSIDYYPNEEKARKAEHFWGLPVWHEGEVRKMMEDAGFSQFSVSHGKRLFFVKATKQ